MGGVMTYDRHRALEEAHRIVFNGQEFKYSQEFGMQLLLAQAALRPDGPFPALLDHVDIVVGNQMLTVRRGDVDQLLDLAQSASVAGLRIINGVKEGT